MPALTLDCGPSAPTITEALMSAGSSLTLTRTPCPRPWFTGYRRNPYSRESEHPCSQRCSLEAAQPGPRLQSRCSSGDDPRLHSPPLGGARDPSLSPPRSSRQIPSAEPGRESQSSQALRDRLAERLSREGSTQDPCDDRAVGSKRLSSAARRREPAQLYPLQL